MGACPEEGPVDAYNHGVEMIDLEVSNDEGVEVKDLTVGNDLIIYATCKGRHLVGIKEHTNIFYSWSGT